MGPPNFRGCVLDSVNSFGGPPQHRRFDELPALLRPGDVVALYGDLGAGKTVLQHLLSQYAAVDIVIVVACGERAGEVVETLTAITGRVELPEPWVMGPYNDAIRGSERVREVAQALRDAGAKLLLDFYRIPAIYGWMQQEGKLEDD